MSEEKKVCITGASGYLASWVVKHFLEEGWTVHGTLRDPSKAAHLHKMSDEYPGKLKLFSADLLAPGSFREAMEGCSVVAHTASPFFSGEPKDPEATFVRPAVEGTRNVLETANETPSVKRVVLTSSVAAIYSDASDMEGKAAFTEEDWNTTSSLGYQSYSYSKTLAERKAWEIAKAQDRWDLVVINPGFILGPSLTPRADSQSIQFMRGMGNGVYRTGTADIWFGMVDIRDVSKAHVLAASRKEASGRHILVNEARSMIWISEQLRRHFGEAYPFPRRIVPKWFMWLVGPLFTLDRKFISRHFGKPLAFDHSYTKSDLGLAFRPMEQTLTEHFQQLLDDGLVRRR